MPVPSLVWFRFRLYTRSSLWVVPVLFVIASIILGYFSRKIDEAFPDVTLGLSTDGARAILETIATGMLTFTGVVFSVVLLAVQFGSSAFSPRLLRTLYRRATIKVAFGTFLFSLIAIGKVSPEPSPGFVPAISVAISIALVLASLLMFVMLLSTVASSLRAAGIVRSIGREGRRVIAEMYPDRLEGDAPPREPRPVAANWAQTVSHKGEPGVIVAIDRRALAATARRTGATIEMIPAVGDFVKTGEPLFGVSGAQRQIRNRLLRRAVAYDDERTVEQDPKFAFRLLVDIANKGLSPAINDPTTAVQAIDQVDSLLTQLADRELDVSITRDHDGRVLLVVPAPRWQDFLELGVGEPLRYGAGSLQISRRLRALLDGLLAAVPTRRRDTVEELLTRLDHSVARSFPDPDERAFALQPDRQGTGSATLELATREDDGGTHSSHPSTPSQPREGQRFDAK